MVDDLVDIVSKNGCLLLNVGPKANGTIPGDQQAVLLELGLWLQINGEAIYESRPWKTYGEGPTKTAVGHISESKNKTMTSGDVRFTTRDGNLYAMIMDWPENGKVDIRALGKGSKYLEAPIKKVTMIGSSEGVDWKQNQNALTVHFPKLRFSDHAWVLKIE